jgi:hypothetical protein
MAFHPTPPQLFDDFEDGRITRAQLHAGLEWHARELVEEIIEAHENPIAAWWDNMLAKRAADRWANRHGIWRVRHVLFALSRIPEFEPSSLLWNALHPDVPLHCFLRMRREPVFRLLQIENRRGILRVRVAHGRTEDGILKEDFILEHIGNKLEAHRAPAEKKS